MADNDNAPPLTPEQVVDLALVAAGISSTLAVFYMGQEHAKLERRIEELERHGQ